MEDTQTTLRDAITASFETVEAGGSTFEKTDDRPRDEQGKFVEKPKEVSPEVKPEVNPELQNAQPAQQEVKVDEQPKAPSRPSTWKKEYLPIWDKIASGQPLTPEESTKLAAYTEQRESEYKSGVSTYKAEAESAKQLQEAIAPFLPELQQYNIKPTQWIQNLGNAHRALSLGSPEQKLQMFSKLAQDYGIPLNAIAQAQTGQQVDPNQLQLMQEIYNLRNQVQSVAGWREQQEQQQLLGEIGKFSSNKEAYPHFELVRENMAQLLESGKAPDLQTAYEMAAQPIEELIEQRLAQVRPTVTSPAAAVAQAKAKAVSTKSATPSGQVTTTNAKDRRAILAEQVEAALGGGRV